MTTKQKDPASERRDQPDQTVLDNAAPESPSDATVLEPDVTAPPDATVVVDAEAIREAEEDVAAEWAVGDVILDLYEVKDIHTGGAMGVVYRVGHRGWNMDLAVKSPRPNYFTTKDQKANFVRECETWIDLGLHPHTVSCHYVRMLGEIPRVFAEYVESGSLSEWIKGGKLYEGGKDEALKRILDVAIQFAWGLEYAHEQGLIHQDVKPGNVMMTPDGVAKMTDFGLAQAKPVDNIELANREGGTVLVKGRGMTPAYCSPEQATGEELSRKTDIWSWGVSLLEMFTGEVTWAGGQLAAEALESFEGREEEEQRIPRMPAGVVELLKGCFQRDPADRPKDMGEVVTRLRDLYSEVTGEEYERPEPKAAELLADGLNNRAVSLLDLGRQEEAEGIFEQALESDPHHPEATYNRGLVLWRSGRLTDDALVKHLEEVRTSHEGDWRDEYYLGLVHMERGDAEAAAEVLGEAAQAVPENDEVQRALKNAGNGLGARRTCVREFKGHKDRVNSVAISGDGHWGISASSDGTLQQWDLTTGDRFRLFEGHEESVNSVAISRDGQWILSGSDDKTLRLWEFASGKCARVFEGHTAAVNFIGITKDGRWGLSGSTKERTLRLWELATGQCVRTIPHHGSIFALAVSPDGSRAVSGKADWTLRLWEPSTGNLLKIFEHTGRVWAVAVTEDGRLAFSGCEDGSLRLWDLATGQNIRTLDGHGGRINSVAVSADGRRSLSGCAAGEIRLWQLDTGQCLRTFRECDWRPTDVDISLNGRWALSGCDKGTLCLWDLGQHIARAGFVVALPRSAAEVGGAAGVFKKATENARQALSHDLPREALAATLEAQGLPGYERHPAVLGMLSEVALSGRRRNVRQSWCANVFTGHSRGVTCSDISPDGLWAISAGGDETLRLWEVTTGHCLRTLEGHTDVIRAAAISSDRRWAITGGEDKTLRLWDLSTGQCRWTVSPFVSNGQGARAVHELGAGGRVYSVAFTPDCRWATTASEDGKLRRWNVETGTQVRVYEGHVRQVNSVKISPDGCWAVSGGEDKTVRLWNLATGECERTFEGHSSEVITVAMSPDQSRVLSGGFDREPRLWEIETGQCIRVLEGHSELVNSVAISADGAWGLSGSWDDSIRVWDLATGECVREIEGHRGRIGSVSISNGMRWVLSGSSDTTLSLWELLWDLEIPDAADWHEGARPYLQVFLTLHCPYGEDGITRTGEPSWDEEDFDQLLKDLQLRGYGWLRREGVRKKLEEMSMNWRHGN